MWAVGYAYDPTFPGFRNFAWHWDGSNWTIVATPNLTATGDNRLLAVSAISTNDAWAVGYSIVDNEEHGVVLRWDGTLWQTVNFPIAPPTFGNALRGVYANTASDVWVIGNYGEDHLTARWDGSTWHRIFDPVNDELTDITVAAPNVAWSAGYDARFTLTIRYDYPCGATTPTPTSTTGPSSTPTATRTGTSTPTGTLPTATQTSTPTYYTYGYPAYCHTDEYSGGNFHRDCNFGSNCNTYRLHAAIPGCA